MRSIVPDNIRNSLTLPSSSTGAPRRPSEVEKAAALHKVMREKPDKEVSYYDNPTILSRLIESHNFSAALERLEKKGPAEASIWVCTKRESSGDGVDVGLEDGSTSLISGLTQSFSQVVHKEAYTFRALPIHMACSCLDQTAVAEKGLWTELERLIAYLAIVNPEGCGRRDLDGRLPLHEAIWHNASPSTVSALLMAAPEAVNEQDILGRYPIALNEHRTGEHKEAVRKLLRLRRKYWDMAREEATLRFKHRNVPSADESITSTSVLAASIADEETLLTTASAFPFASASATIVGNPASHDNDNDQRRNLYKATNVTQTGREPIQPISWSQLEDRARLAEQKLEQVNEANYILTKQVIELKAVNKEVQDKLDRYTKTDLGRQVKRLETEKQDLTWLVQQLQGILLRNGIALDPEEANFVNPPREVKAVAGGGGKESAKNVVENVNKPPTDNAKSSSSDERQQQQQQPQEQQQQQQREQQQQQQKEQKEKVQQHVEASEAENQQHQSLQPAVAAKTATTTHKHSVLETNERLGNGFVLNQKPPPVASVSAQSAPASQINKYARHDDDNENESESEHDGNSCSIGPYSFGGGSQQSRLEYDMQVLEEMNERVRQLVLSESATNYQGQSLYPQFAARPKVDVQQQQQQQRSCLKEPPASTPQQGVLEEENEMDKKPQAKPSVVSQKDPPQSAAATHVEDPENNTTINKKQQATTVADFDVTCSNDSQSSFPISTIEEEESEEGMEQSALKPTGAASSSGDASGKSHDGISIASVDQDDAEDKNEETVSCSNQNEVDDTDMDDLDSVLAEAVKLNGGKGLSPDILRLWRETTTSSYGLSNISLPSMLEEHLQQQQGLNGGKGLSPEMLRLWRETSAASFDVSAVSLPNMFEQHQQQQQQDEASACSSSTDTRENKRPPHKKKSPATASPTSSPSSVGETLGTTSAMMCQSQNNHVTCNVKSNTDYCMNTDRAAAAAAAHASSDHAKSSNINQRSLFGGAAAKKPPSLDDMTVFTDDMSRLFSRAAKIYTEGRGSDDGAAST